jgi:hypothetical protein
MYTGTRRSLAYCTNPPPIHKVSGGLAQLLLSLVSPKRGIQAIRSTRTELAPDAHLPFRAGTPSGEALPHDLSGSEAGYEWIGSLFAA